MKSFNFVRKLIEVERYKEYKKDTWGGADVVIVSSNIDDERKQELHEWKNESKLRKLVITKHAMAVIWFIETLKPYVNYDYLNKFDYYSEIADFVIEHESLDDKDLLLSLLKRLGRPTDTREKSWEKTLHEELEEAKILDAKIHNTILDWQSWYNYGIEHNNPFFVKFMTLWIAFNEQYKKYLKYSERKAIEYFCKKNMQKLLNKYDDVFIKSKLTEEFCNKNALGKYYIMDMRATSFNSPYATKEEENKYIQYREEDCENIKSENKELATLALFSSMYSVRCNLFHGGKDATNERDIELVRCSGEILEIYLNALM